MRDRHNIVPMSMAVLLHVLVFGTFFVAFDWGRQQTPAMPLAVKATLVTDSGVTIPPPVERRPEPLPEPEPEVVEPPPPDPAELERERLEEQKRLEDLAAEQERIRIEAEAEAKRQADLEAQRRADEEARRIAEEKALEERRRKAEEDRKRAEEEQRRRNREEEARLLAAEMQSQIDAEAEQLAARESPEMAIYITQISQKIQRNWIRPGTAPDNLECVVRVSQLSSGAVTRVQVVSCNAGDVVARSVEAAVRKASPLPLPTNPLLFTKELRLTFRVQE